MKKADVWTNAFYGLAGIGAFVVVEGMYGSYLMLAFASLMVGSTAFHGKLHPMGQAMDEVSMYISFSAILGYVVSMNPLVSLAVAICVGAGLGLNWRRVDSFIAMPTLAALCLLASLVRANAVYVLLLAVALILSVAIRQLGEHKESEALHGIWHFTTAACMLGIVWVTT